VEQKIRMGTDNRSLECNLNKNGSYTFATFADRGPKIIKLLLVFYHKIFTLSTKF
jgi:hypothetical protein